MYLVVEPISFILPSICPDIAPITIYFVVGPGAGVVTPISPSQFAVSFFLPLPEVAFKFAAVGHVLSAKAMLAVVMPVPFVPVAVAMDVSAVAFRLVIFPVPFIHVSVDVDELPFTISPVGHPGALVPGSIWPHLHALSFPHRASPGSSIHNSIVELHGSFFHNVPSLLSLHPHARIHPVSPTSSCRYLPKSMLGICSRSSTLGCLSCSSC